MIGMMVKGMMKAMKASEGPPIIVAISPDMQGLRAYDLLGAEQKGVLRYALVDYGKRHKVKVSLWPCIRGTGEICWGFEAKTNRNKRPALRLWPRRKV